MKIIVPMAGMGKRMRPHTLTVPKPLVHVAGKPIVEHLINDIAQLAEGKVDEVAFVIGRFGKPIEEQLLNVAANIGAQGSIYYQDEPLGTAHAIYQAHPSLDGPCVIAFADTLFYARFALNIQADGIIWTKEVDDPRAFGVVNKNTQGIITEFEEKPEKPRSNEAIIGIYYFKDAAVLRSEIKYLLDHGIMGKGEYQITDALENMKNKGMQFMSQTVDEWMDCGNYAVTVETNGRYLELKRDRPGLVSADVIMEQAVVVPPCYIGPGVVLRHCVVGPRVSIGTGSSIEHSILSDSIIQTHSTVRGLVAQGAMIGSHVKIHLPPRELSLGDYNELY
ncbi:MAG: 2-C-methyl-D-erythritol 4-phosphate cytidylyltransferase [Bacteroidetes bacterium]|nr:2-C-methyl-D-erythritol 4-phosphate cytidylyltransferase [Bacteroidota bacterium]